MKKLALIVLVAALSMTPAATLADGNGWKHFAGVYEMSASGSCIHSEGGYTIGSDGWYSANAGVIYAGTTVSNGTWTFDKNGTGTYSYTMYATVTPPIQQPSPPIAGGIRIFTSDHKVGETVVGEYTFTYTIHPLGNITINTQEGDTLSGSISIDKKSITLFDAIRVKGPPPTSPYWNPFYRIICTATRTLIKVND
jgi:hypothetical protein